MLTRQTIADIVNVRLPESEIREHLAELKPDALTAEVVADFIDVARSTVDRKLLDAVSTLTDALDCSGTGGSGLAHFNTSTASAFVLAAGGVRVAKFGNRSSRSGSGSFDFLEALGISVEVEPERIADIYDACGVVFLFAPQFYPALARLASVRRSIPHATIFNFVGPLLNPCLPAYRVFGVSNADVCGLMAKYLGTRSEVKRALVVHSSTGLDELVPGVENIALSIERSAEPGLEPTRKLRMESVRFETERSGMEFFRQQCEPAAPHSEPARAHMGQREITTTHQDHLNGESAPCTARTLSVRDNVRIFKSIIGNGANIGTEFLEGPVSQPFFLDLIALNAAAGFVVTGRASSFVEGFELSKELIASGEVKRKVEEVTAKYAKRS